jgi:hypothetical protein
LTIPSRWHWPKIHSLKFQQALWLLSGLFAALELAKKQFVTGESRFFNNFRSNFEGILPPSGRINRHIKHRIFNS